MSGGQVNGRLGEMEGSSPGFDSGTTSRATNPYDIDDIDGPVAAEKTQDQEFRIRPSKVDRLMITDRLPYTEYSLNGVVGGE